MSSDNLSRVIGVIGKPHGVKGYVYVRMFTDYPKTIIKGNILYLDEDCLKGIKVEDIRFINLSGGPRIIFKFEAVENRVEAEKLRNLVLYRSIQNQPSLKKNTYWIDDLRGCSLFLTDKSFVGVVTGVENYAYNDNIIVKTENKGVLAIPLLEEYIESIDTDRKVIILKKIPEYL